MHESQGSIISTALGQHLSDGTKQMRHLIHTRGKIGERLVYRVLRSLLVNIAVTVCLFTIANTQLKRFALLLSLKMHFQKAS